MTDTEIIVVEEYSSRDTAAVILKVIKIYFAWKGFQMLNQTIDRALMYHRHVGFSYSLRILLLQFAAGLRFQSSRNF